MTPNDTQSEMQTLLTECLQKGSHDTLIQCMAIYEKTFGRDSFYLDIANSYVKDEPLLTLVCFQLNDEQVDNFLSSQTYSNIEIVRFESSDTYKDLCDFFSTTNSTYICFLEPSQKFNPTAFRQMVKYLSTTNCDMVITARNFIDSSNTIIAHPDAMYQNSLKGKVFNGKPFFELCLEEGVNLFGTLSTLMVSTQYAKTIPWDFPNYECDEINRFALLSQFIIHGSAGYIDTPLVSTIVQEYSKQDLQEKYYKHYINRLYSKNLISLSPDKIFTQTPVTYNGIPKHITFFCTSVGERFNLQPIADEAQKRGYVVEFTDNIQQKAAIGVYCQHLCYPENSAFSLILLHDMAQGHNRWPNLWERERWNHFDIGILPGEDWAERWSACACQYYANPRCGTFLLGYPKNDIVNSNELKLRAQELREQFNFKYNFTVLYAPSWENDEKEDDFVRALVSLPVNLIIKQAKWPSSYPHIVKNIAEMRFLHENKYDNVHFIEPEESIMTALELCDVVVSEESSVMAEAIMFNKPSLAVYDWLIPDTTPSRFASVPIDYVLKCKKVELREYVEKLSSDSTFYKYAQSKFTNVFVNKGHCCEDILDAIDYYTQGESKCDFLGKKLSSKYIPYTMWN